MINNKFVPFDSDFLFYDRCALIAYFQDDSIFYHVIKKEYAYCRNARSLDGSTITESDNPKLCRGGNGKTFLCILKK